MSQTLPYKQTPLHDLVRELELRAPQIAYWGMVSQREAALWLAVHRPLPKTSQIALFWCLISLYTRIRKIQTQGTADMNVTVWATVQKAGLGRNWFALIERKIRAIEDQIPRCKDYLSRDFERMDFIVAAELASQRGLISEATAREFVAALAPAPPPS